jgi:hypothetical protein
MISEVFDEDAEKSAILSGSHFQLNRFETPWPLLKILSLILHSLPPGTDPVGPPALGLFASPSPVATGFRPRMAAVCRAAPTTWRGA